MEIILSLIAGTGFGFILGALSIRYLGFCKHDEAEYIKYKHGIREMTEKEKIDFDTYFANMDEFFGEFDKLFKKFPKFKSRPPHTM